MTWFRIRALEGCRTGMHEWAHKWRAIHSLHRAWLVPDRYPSVGWGSNFWVLFAHPIDTQAGNNHLLCANYSSNTLLTSSLSTSTRSALLSPFYKWDSKDPCLHALIRWEGLELRPEGVPKPDCSHCITQSHPLSYGGSHTGKWKTMELKAMQPLQRNMSEPYMQGYAHMTCPSQGPNLLVTVAVMTEECDDNHLKHAQWSVNLRSLWVILFISVFLYVWNISMLIIFGQRNMEASR